MSDESNTTAISPELQHGEVQYRGGDELEDDPRYAARVTLREIATQAGVHPATVSRALSDDKSAMVSDATRARVLKTAEALGYEPSIPARTLRQGRSQTMGVIVADLGNPYTGQIVRGIENALEGRGIMALIAETQDDIDRMGRVLNHLFSRSVDAVITTAARAGTESILNKAYRRVPVVLADRALPGSELRTVAPDDVLGARLVAAHLLELGHERIALLRGPSGISSFDRRTIGFREAIEESGAELVDLDDEAAEPSIQEGRRLAAGVLDMADRATAIFAENDLMAVGALDQLSRTGVSCPREMSIVGYDDLQLTEFTNPPLTTVRLPGYQLGRFAAEMAVSLSEDETIEVTDLTLSPSLVQRGSSSPVGGYPDPS